MALATNLYTQTAPNPGASACDSIPVGGSIIAFANTIDKCSAFPNEYRLGVSAALTTSSTSAGIFVSLKNGVASVTGDSVFLSKGTVLYFGATATPTNKVVVSKDTLVTGIASGSATTVPIDPPAAAISATDLADTWALIRLPSWQDVSVNDSDQTADSTEGQDFYSSETVVSKTIQIPLNFKLRDDLAAYKKILHPLANQSYRSGFLALMRNGFPVMAGTFKFMNRQRPGAMKTQTMVTGTCSMQGSIYLPGYPSEMQVASADLNLYKQVLQLSGFNDTVLP